MHVQDIPKCAILPSRIIARPSANTFVFIQEIDQRQTPTNSMHAFASRGHPREQFLHRCYP